MGKRKKSSRKPGAKKKMEPLDTTFSCIFCHHDKSVACKIDKKEGLGHLYCKICGQSFQTKATALTEPVDVFADWIDSSEAASKMNPQLARGPISPTTPTAGGSSRAGAVSLKAIMEDDAQEEATTGRRFVQEDSDDD